MPVPELGLSFCDRSFNLETAGGRKKDPYDIGVHREREKVVVTLEVMRHFSVLRGAPRSLSEIRDRCEGVLV